MAMLPGAMRSGVGDDRPARSVLRVEMQAGERRLLHLFASSFVKWIKDQSASTFAADVGEPASISSDESAREAGTPTLHLTLTWLRSSTQELPARPDSFLFTYDSETPLVEPWPAEANIAAMMAIVLEQSARLPRSTGAGWLPVEAAAPLVAEAARGRQILARWRNTASASTAAALGRALARGRHVAALAYSARVAGRAHVQSAVHVLRSRSAVVKPMTWAAASLFAMAFVYAGWSITRPATRPGASVIAAATEPTGSQPAPVILPDPEKSAGAVMADARLPGTAPLPTSGVVHAAATTPSAAPSHDTTHAIRVKPASQERGYVGALVVTSDPNGAAVSVDGVPQGLTPLTIPNLNIGSRVVRVELPGHQRWSWAVTVVANKQTPIAVRLLPTTPAAALPSVDVGDAPPARTRMF